MIFYIPSQAQPLYSQVRMNRKEKNNNNKKSFTYIHQQLTFVNLNVFLHW